MGQGGTERTSLGSGPTPDTKGEDGELENTKGYTGTQCTVRKRRTLYIIFRKLP